MSNIKTIAQVLPSLNSGGVERGTIEIADIIVKAKYKSMVISNGGRLVKNLEKNGISSRSVRGSGIAQYCPSKSRFIVS